MLDLTRHLKYLDHKGRGICWLKLILSNVWHKIVKIIKCYVTFKNIFLISGRHLFSWNWLASNIKDLSFSLSPPLCSNFQDVHGIFGSLQMKFTVTHGVIVKRVHMYFIRNMYPLSRGKSLTSNNAIRFRSILMPFFPHVSGGILKYTDDLHYLNVYVWTSLKHVLR